MSPSMNPSIDSKYLNPRFSTRAICTALTALLVLPGIA